MLGVARITVVTLVALSLGLHWAFLQTVAWTGMLVRYSQANSLGTAITMTFDGEHPCELCHVIKKGREEEQQRERQQVKPAKLDLAILPPATFSSQAQPYPMVNPAILPLSPRIFTPPKPPPRAAFAAAV